MNDTITQLRKLRHYFADLELIAQRQEALLEQTHTGPAEDNVGRLTGLIEQRQEIMQLIETASALLKQARAAAPGEGTLLSAAEQAEETAIKASITAARAHDKACQAAAQAFLQAIGEQLGQARRNTMASKYYAGSNEPLQAYFFDRHK